MLTIPGPFSILYSHWFTQGRGTRFKRPQDYEQAPYREMKPISQNFEQEALRVNGLNRSRLCADGEAPERVMTEACRYFIRSSADGSPFDYSRCFDIKTALAVKAAIPISQAGRSRLHPLLRSRREHTHHTLDDAIEQAEIFANIFEWEGINGRTRQSPPSGKACVYATGSFGLREAIFIVGLSNGRKASLLGRLNEICVKADLI